MRWPCGAVTGLAALLCLTVPGCDLYFSTPQPQPPAPDAPSPPPPLFASPVVYSAHAPVAVAVGDVDGDGTPDVVVAGGDGQGNVDVLFNSGGGAFGAAVTAVSGSCPFGVTVGDFDGDGRVDAATADACDNTTVVLSDMGSGGFSAVSSFAAGVYPMAITTGDFNHDGISDLAVASYFGLANDGVSVLLGTGSGGFAPQVRYGSAFLDAIAVGDVNGDGALDLVTATSGGAGADGTVNTLLNHGDGTFTAPTSSAVGVDPESVALADLNEDGWLDAVTANAFNDGVSVVLGKGDGTFGSPTNYLGGSISEVAIADVDGDGKPDIVVASNGGSFTVMVNAGDGTFPTSWAYPCGACGRLVMQDVNGDRKPDMIGIDVRVTELGISSQGSGVSVMLHTP